MSVTYLGDTTELEEGKTYTMRWSIPDYAGQTLWATAYEHYYYNHADEYSDFRFDPLGGYGRAEASIDSNGNASFTVEIIQDDDIDPNEFFYLYFYAGDNAYRSWSNKISENGGRTKFVIADIYPDTYNWEFQFSRLGTSVSSKNFGSGEVLGPLIDIKEGEQVRGDGYDNSAAYLSIIPKKSYPAYHEIYYKIFAETDNKRKLVYSGSHDWRQSSYPATSLKKFDFRDDDQKDTTYTAYLYSDSEFTRQIGNTPSLIVRDFQSYYYDVRNNKKASNYGHSKYDIHSGAGNGSGINLFLMSPPVVNTNRVYVEKVFVGTSSSDSLKGYSGDNFGADLLDGGEGADTLIGYRGADFLAGGAGNDELRAGNGRDIITGGAGSDTMYGGFGLNTFEDEADGAADSLYFKSDQWAVNWLNGKAGNNPNGEKADTLVELDPFDSIYIQGVKTEDLSFKRVVHRRVRQGWTSQWGIGIFASGYLEAIYIGDDLSMSQIEEMTEGTFNF